MMGKWSSLESSSNCCISLGVVICSRQSLRMSTRRMTLKAGSIAFFVWVSAEMPPSPRPTRLVSKYGRAILLATKMAARLAEHRGRMALGNAKTSKTVIAMAKARQTAAQKAAAPTIARRAKKAPRRSSVTTCSPVDGMRSASTRSVGSRDPMTRPRRPPMIMVGATTPAGDGNESAKIVVVHFMRKQSTSVAVGPMKPRDHEDSSMIRSLSKSVDNNRGCGLPSSNGKAAARTVFTTTTTVIWKRSRHCMALLAAETKEVVMADQEDFPCCTVDFSLPSKDS
mmetsp:Transcript_2618/g.7928  ORF Transcript_2618/g.7928 Transcript_2618/m.7928 type:complete len:283 (-) Transcript_2618:878-1726(-)